MRKTVLLTVALAMLVGCGARRLNRAQFVRAGNIICEDLQEQLAAIPTGTPATFYTRAVEINEAGEENLRALRAPAEIKLELDALLVHIRAANAGLRAAARAKTDMQRARAEKRVAGARVRSARVAALLGLNSCTSAR